MGYSSYESGKSSYNETTNYNSGKSSYESGKSSYEAPSTPRRKAAKISSSSELNDAKDLIFQYMELVKGIEDLEKQKGELQAQKKKIEAQIRKNPDCMQLLNLLGKDLLPDAGYTK